MRLDGVDGSHLPGFVAAVGALALLDQYSRTNGGPRPRLHFDSDFIASLDVELQPDALVEVLFTELLTSRPFFENELSEIQKPTDFTPSLLAKIAAGADLCASHALAGLACCVGDSAFESTLCAANGAGHQNLVQSIRDVLLLTRREHLHAALFAPWLRSYAVSPEDRRAFGIGSRKPTLRLDAAEERLYALRLADPTSTDDFTTELGAQALAVPAFSVLPVLPQKRPVTVASVRTRNRVTFSWPLWNIPTTLTTTRSLLAAGIQPQRDLRARGVFAAFRATRVSGDKGKLSFTPTEGAWSYAEPSRGESASVRPTSATDSSNSPSSPPPPTHGSFWSFD